jgi:hypothetical protein
MPQLRGVEPGHMHGRHFVRLIVAAVLALGVICTERHKRVQHAPIDGELDDSPACPITAHDIASLKNLPQQLASIVHRPPRGLSVAGRNHRACAVNEA